MRKVFIAPYNSRLAYPSSRLLIVADCKVDKNFIDELCGRLNTNADLLYIDYSGRERGNIITRHFSYLLLAIKTFRMENKYDHIIFWQQFIGLYWSLLFRIKKKRGLHTLVIPLIYKKRKGFAGRLYEYFFKTGLSGSSLNGAIIHSSDELKYYQRIFPSCRNKLYYIPYGQRAETTGDNIGALYSRPYFFSGGTSNRNYAAIMGAAAKMKNYTFVLACTRSDIKGLDVPPNVMVFYDAYGNKFDSLLKGSFAVILTLSDPNISAGQIVLLKAMQWLKPVIVSRTSGITDYVDEYCAFLVEHADTAELHKTLEFVLSNPGEVNAKVRNAEKKYYENYTVEKFANAVSNLMNNPHR